MATVVVALGGSLLRPEVEERHKWLEEMVGVVKNSVSSGVKLALVVGGGAPAREGIDLARPVIHDLSHLDRIGIAATRLAECNNSQRSHCRRRSRGFREYSEKHR